jgi:hypothetical protein
VFAFEPARSVYQKLAERFAEEKDFIAFDVAVGEADAPPRPNRQQQQPIHERTEVNLRLPDLLRKASRFQIARTSRSGAWKAFANPARFPRSLVS